MKTKLPEIFLAFEFDDESKEEQAYLDSLQTIINELSPASWKMFKVINRSKYALSRIEIVQALGRKKVSPYDIRQLNDMIEAGLLSKRRQRRPLVNGYPSGYKLVYQVPAKVKRALNELAKRRKASPPQLEPDYSSMTDDELFKMALGVHEPKGWLHKLVRKWL